MTCKIAVKWLLKPVCVRACVTVKTVAKNREGTDRPLNGTDYV